VSLNMIFPLK